MNAVVEHAAMRTQVDPSAAIPVDDGVARRRWWGVVLPLVAIAAIVSAAGLMIADPILRRATAIVGACLVLWLTELTPLYATTLLLWAAVVLLLGPLDARAFALPRVLSPAVNPVILLCFGGFALSAAGAKYGVDAYIARWVVRASGGRRRVLLFAVMAATAVLSMWMLNIAAAAMMVSTLRPLFARRGGDAGTGAGAGAAVDEPDDESRLRTALLVGLAFAANFGGIATPIGTGPNLVAIGAVAGRHAITFPEWMLFGVPIAVAMLTLTYALLVGLYRVGGPVRPVALASPDLGGRGWCVVAIFCATVAAWLLEPVHRVPSAVVALAMTAALFATRLLDEHDLRGLGWETLILIAGGLALGQLFEDSGLARKVAAGVEWQALSPTVFVLGLVVACAGISAVASNTAAAAMLIQVAIGIAPSPQTAVLVALGASMGVPVVISTPPNAIAYGEGELRPRDFLVPGMILMAAGCAGLAVFGPAVLRMAGVPQ
jgi:sodium-dependent dicarboxylate transporter 2/3/5